MSLENKIEVIKTTIPLVTGAVTGTLTYAVGVLRIASTQASPNPAFFTRDLVSYATIQLGRDLARNSKKLYNNYRK